MSFSPGGTGKIATSTDVALNTPTNDQVLTYNTALAKWQNKTIIVPAQTSDLANNGTGIPGAVFPTMTGATKIAVVSVMPQSPDATTLYFVTN